MENLKNEVISKIKLKGYTVKGFSETFLDIDRTSLYRKLNDPTKFKKLEKEKIKNILEIDII